MNGELVTFVGPVTNMREFVSSTKGTMIIFSVGNKSCRAFNEFVEGICVCSQGGAELEITAREGEYQGKPQYTVIDYDIANKRQRMPACK